MIANDINIGELTLSRVLGIEYPQVFVNGDSGPRPEAVRPHHQPLARLGHS
jgi:hypothetical protein